MRESFWTNNFYIKKEQHLVSLNNNKQISIDKFLI